MNNRGLRILAYMMIVASIGLFVWEVAGRVVHKPHLYGIFILGLMGAYFADPPGTYGFVTLVLKVVPWNRASPTTEREVVLNPGKQNVVEVEVKQPNPNP